MTEAGEQQDMPMSATEHENGPQTTKSFSWEELFWMHPHDGEEWPQSDRVAFEDGLLNVSHPLGEENLHNFSDQQLQQLHDAVATRHSDCNYMQDVHHQAVKQSLVAIRMEKEQRSRSHTQHEKHIDHDQDAADSYEASGKDSPGGLAGQRDNKDGWAV